MLSEGHKTSPREEPHTRSVVLVWGYGSGLVLFAFSCMEALCCQDFPPVLAPSTTASLASVPWCAQEGSKAGSLPHGWARAPLCLVQGICTPLPSLGPRGDGGHAAGWLWAAQESPSHLPSASTREPSQWDRTAGAALHHSHVPAAPAQTCQKQEAILLGGERRRRVCWVDGRSTAHYFTVAISFGRKVPAYGRRGGSTSMFSRGHEVPPPQVFVGFGQSCSAGSYHCARACVAPARWCHTSPSPKVLPHKADSNWR